MRIVFASSEVSPYAKTGGLGDVIGSLPQALAALGHQVSVFAPLYLSAYRHALDHSEPLGRLLPHVGVPIWGLQNSADVWHLEKKGSGVDYFFIGNGQYFMREGIYTARGDGYDDSMERYAFFSRAVLETLRQLGMRPDILHCNDWHTGLIPTYLKSVLWRDPFFSRTATVFTIHNLAYQGYYGAEKFQLLGLPREMFDSNALEFHGGINLMKGGIQYADQITAVSPSYAREIQTPNLGEKLDGLLRSRSWALSGIVNGVDYKVWSPQADVYIERRYRTGDWEGKQANTRALWNEAGWNWVDGVPTIGLVARLSEQKGLDILLPVMEAILNLNVRFVLLGSGENRYENALRTFADRFPGSMRAAIGFETRLAHAIEAGSDLFLMPSRYEPCGLNQLYSLKYGTLPVVHSTGGLRDTVMHYNGHNEMWATGFAFENYDSNGLLWALGEALGTYHKNPATWRRLAENAMNADFSWERSARQYLDVYHRALDIRHSL